MNSPSRLRVVFLLALAAGTGSVAVAASRPLTAFSPDPLTAGKLSIEQRYAEQMVAAPKATGPKDPDGARPSDPAGLEAWPSGIFDDQEAPFPAAQYLVQNRWQQDFGGNHVVVYAGALGSDESQGVLVIQVLSTDLSRVSAREILGPRGKGALRITAAMGHVLTIRSASGFNAHFDVDGVALTP